MAAGQREASDHARRRLALLAVAAMGAVLLVAAGARGNAALVAGESPAATPAPATPRPGEDVVARSAGVRGRMAAPRGEAGVRGRMAVPRGEAGAAGGAGASGGEGIAAASATSRPAAGTDGTGTGAAQAGTGAHGPAPSGPQRRGWGPPPGPGSSGLVPVVPPSPPGWVITAGRLEIGGLDRYYLVARPEHVTASVLPLLVVLHGRDLTPAAMETISGFLPVVGQALVVYPAGYEESWNAGYCCGLAAQRGVDDVAFVEATIRQVLATQPGTSPRSVYLVGYSNGGRLAYELACDDPGAFAGVAAVEAVPLVNCPSTRPVPIVAIASTGDPIVSVAGAPRSVDGRVQMTVDALAERWRQLEGCRAAEATATRGSLTVTTWSNCRPPGRIELGIYQGGSHAWPRGRAGAPPAQQVIWSAFQPAVSLQGTSVSATDGGVG